MIHRYNLYLSRSAAALAAVCAVAAFLYGIFLLMAVAHTAARAEAQRKITSINAVLGDVEQHYLTQEEALTPEYAQALGFETPESVSSVYASAAAHDLTINENR